MFGFGEGKESADKAYGDSSKHEGKLSHEVLAGGAAFVAMQLFEKHQRDSGEPVSHARAKEIIAGFAAAEADKLLESKGRDKYDEMEQQHAKKKAAKQAQEMYDSHYGDMDEYNPNKREQHESINITDDSYQL